jgi:hypothetical protein
MTVKGYATPLDVQLEYGTALTPAQLFAADVWLEAAELLVDRETGQAWATGARTERHWLSGPWLTLRSTAVTGITAVRAYAAESATATTLTEDTHYWLEGATLHLPSWTGYQRLEVDYTPSTAIPVPIRMATAAWVAAWLAGASDALLAAAKSLGIRSLQLGFGELIVDFDSAEKQVPVPPRVAQLLAPYKARLVVA